MKIVNGPRAALTAILGALLACCGGSGLDLPYPEEFFMPANNAQRFERFAENWNEVLGRRRLRGLVVVAGGARFDSVAQGTTVLRVSNTDCGGYKVQEQLGLWRALKEQFEADRFLEVRFSDQQREGPAADWVLGLYPRGPERSRAEERIARYGWLWAIVPSEPQILVTREGRIRPGGLVCGLPEVFWAEQAELAARLRETRLREAWLQELPGEREAEWGRSVAGRVGLFLGLQARTSGGGERSAGQPGQGQPKEGERR